jgi:TonB family protein
MQIRTVALAAALAVAALSRPAHAQDSTVLAGPCESSTAAPDTSGLTADPETPARIKPGSKLLPFPKELRFSTTDLTAMISFIVTADGSLRRNSLAIVSSPSDVMSRWACQSVEKLRFEPAQDHGKRVASRVTMPLRYQTPVNR